MTFSEVQTELMRRARKRSVCPDFHDFSLATTYDEMVAAMLPSLNWSLENGVVDATILTEFDPSSLLKYGVYFNVTDTIVAPPEIPYPFFDGYEIWIILGADITLGYTGAGKYKINAYICTYDITISDNTYLDIKTFKAIGTLRQEGNSIAVIVVHNTGGELFTHSLSGNSIAKMETHNYSQVTMGITDTPFCKLIALDKSVVNVDIAEDPEVILGRKFQQAQINYGAPV